MWFSWSTVPIGLHGHSWDTYDAVSMLESLGPFYHVVVLLEVAMWGSLLFMGWIKLDAHSSGRAHAALTSISH